MTDAEINLTLAKYFWSDLMVEIGNSGCALIDVDGGSFKTFDYRNWSDLMPHVVEHLTPYDVLKAISNPNIDKYFNDDPQKALALCLIKVLEAQKDV